MKTKNYAELLEPPTAEQLISCGYRRTSNKYQMVSRIDRKDWQQFMIAEGNGQMLHGNYAASFYRRIYSQDGIVGVPRDIFRQIPSSDFDQTGYIQDNGVPHPGYDIVLVERTS